MKNRDYSEETEFIGPKQMWKNRLICRILKKNRVSGRLFEGGFGQGKLASDLQRLPVEYSGIEYSGDLVKHVQGKNPKIRTRFNRGDITKIRETDETFDAVVSSDVLEHVKEDKKAVSEFYRILKKDGLCIITVPLQMKDWTFVDEWSGHYRRYSLVGLKRLFSDAGFRDIRLIPYSYSLVRFYYYRLYIPFQKKRKGTDLKKRNRSGIFRHIIRNISKVFYLLFMIDPLFKNDRPMNVLLYARK